ncbi:MAG: hypothetical protein IT247_02335 [Bacteroidia bacterium]|nr:hypothetical protein [Bacteroidia bacterium]
MKKQNHPKSLVSEEEIRYMRQSQTYTQRFDLLMKLIRLDKMMKSAKIIKP